MHPFSQKQDSVVIQQYQEFIDDLNQQVVCNKPQDVLQFCFDYFLKKILQERSESRIQGTLQFDQQPEEDAVDLLVFKSLNLKNRRVSVSAESMQPTHNKTSNRPTLPKPKTEIDMIQQSLKSHFLFKSLEEEQQQVIDCMEQKQFSTGDTVIEQGAVGDFFYIVSSGQLDCFVNNDLVTHYERGGSFGELALMYNAPRAATIKATSNVTLWALDRVSFRSLVMETHAQKRHMHEAFLKEVPLFKSLELSEIHKIADALEPVSFRHGDIILKQGDTGDNFYLIEKGNALFYQQTDEPNSQPQKVNEMKKGDYFGELALLTDKPRAATVIAKGDVKCVTLGKDAFTRLLGPVMDILKRNTTNYNAILKQVQS